MQQDPNETVDADERPIDVQAATLDNSPWRPGSSIVAFLSTVGAATFVSLLIGLFYYYTHHYREAYLGHLGLDPEALPITTQEAIVEGFDGIVTTILWKLALVTLFIPIYLGVVWVAATLIDSFATRLGVTNVKRTPPPVLVALGRSAGFRASLLGSAIALGATLFSILAVALIGLPAIHAGENAARVLLVRVQSTAQKCARYELKSGKKIVGWPIGSTPDHQFVLGNDCAAHIVKFDDLQRLAETGVPCRTSVAGSKSTNRERAPVRQD